MAETVRSYLVFYAVTSLLWDSMRMAGNFVLILSFGMPVLRVLRRFHDRFTYTYSPVGPPAPRPEIERCAPRCEGEPPPQATAQPRR